jgi:DNA-binding CsgD family transcriptional regulator
VEKADSNREAQTSPTGSAPDAAVANSAEVMPASDPAFAVLSGILKIVRVTRWNFARLDGNGELMSSYGSHTDGNELAALADEYERQVLKAKVGPRIAATLGSLDDLASGITLLFADARAHFGILTLLRSADLGPFTSSEISVLTFALDALSDQLSALRLQPQTRPPSVPPVGPQIIPPEREEAFYVLDSDLQIVLAWNSGDQRRIALTGLHTRIIERLPKLLENTVREMTTAWASSAAPSASAMVPVPFLVVRTQPMSGPAGLFIGVRIERFVPPNSLTGAAQRYHISPREVQVLALLLDGDHLDQMAKKLNITSSTVQDHIKSMLDKTGSANRSELIARVLGWESTPRAAPI